MGWLEAAEKGAIVVGGVGTFLLALYAYFGEEWRKRRSSPKLGMEVHEKSGHTTWDSNENLVRHYSVRIVNKTTVTEAKRVRVRLLSLFRKTDSGYEEETPPAPLHLNWTATPNESGTFLHSPFSNLVTFDTVTLGHLDKEEEFFKLETNPQRNSFPGILWRNIDALIVIEVSGENAINAGRYFIELAWKELKESEIWDAVIPFITQISEHEFNHLIAS